MRMVCNFIEGRHIPIDRDKTESPARARLGTNKL